MKLGFDLLLWTTHVTDEHWHIIEALKAAGYDGIEIPMFGGRSRTTRRLAVASRTAGSSQRASRCSRRVTAFPPTLMSAARRLMASSG